MRTDRHEYYRFKSHHTNLPYRQQDVSDGEFWAAVVQYGGAGLLMAGATYIFFFL